MNEHYGNPHASRTSTALLQSQNLMSLSLTCELRDVDSTFWIRFTLVNPWECYSMSKEKLRWMAEALKKGGAKKNTLKKILNYLLKLGDEISRIKEQLTK